MIKKLFKKETILGFIIGILIASGITVYAASYLAQDINYTDEKSVANALDELYNLKTSTVQNLIDSSTENTSAELDYNNMINIANNLNAVTNTYTFLKNGQLTAQMGIDAGGYYYAKIEHNNTAINWIFFHNSGNGGEQYTDHTIVNKGDVITVTHVKNVQPNKNIIFIPFK